MPTKFPSDPISCDRESERAEKQNLFDLCFSTPPHNNLLCADVLFAPVPAPAEYRSEAEKYFFGLKSLLLHHLPTADILFHHIPPPSDPSKEQKLFDADPPAAETRHLSLQFAIVPYSGRREKNSPTPSTLSPQYLHPPDETMPLPKSYSIITDQHHIPPRTTTTNSDQSPDNFDLDNPVW